MRIVLLMMISFIPSSYLFCQIYYPPLSFPKFSMVNRSVFIKFFSDRNKIIYLDYKEGLSLYCDSVKTHTPGQTQENEQIMPYLFGKYWRVFDHLSEEGLTIYFPDNQTMHDWQEMISIQRIDAQGQNSKKLYTSLIKVREKRCPGKTKSEIIENSKNYTLYKSISEECEEFESQAELSIILSPPKFLLGQYMLWKIEYVTRNSDSESFFNNEKLDWFRNIELLTGKELDAYLSSN